MFEFLLEEILGCSVVLNTCEKPKFVIKINLHIEPIREFINSYDLYILILTIHD